jgi:predicted dehydrogenase
MARRVRWGIFGTGMIAAEFARALADSPEADLVAVASRSLPRAEQFTSEMPSVVAVGSYEELASMELDVVYIATPQHRHHDDALLALEHGLHVVVEKPAALSVSEVEDMIRARDRASRIAIEAMWTYFNPLVERLVTIARSGTLGSLRSLHANSGPIGIPRDHRALARDLGGSYLWECLVYPLSVLTALAPHMQRPDDQHIASLRTSGGVDFAAAVTLRGGDTIAQFGGGFALDTSGAAQSRMQLIFDHGWVELSEIYNPIELNIGWDDGRVERFEAPAQSVGFGYEVAAVNAAIRGEKKLPSYAMLEHTLGNTALLEQLGSGG